ncbi:alpha/beta fold hydrolase [Verrucosispora sp. WMMD703]|uniref:Arylesterase n=1 Tax=Micromonospora sediminimaris TaxID=547162 RepID=A0A9W5UPQ9_9ACTN|nr:MULTISPECIES: alpha/beta hydrolase [Micromonospora]MBQ1049827.1 alpha/beta hydrolase [Micromonospora sp. C51]WFE45073.1 alpha/beta hydrolase [Verrucosispora sp. WMMD1129]GIJ32364.1 arylesterase [Micromonospora sediminimaris]SFD33578.1 non-heme chloroperoxidase [Micromonospora sediminimaris]
MPFITVGTENSAPIDLYYEDHGSGQPIVLIHGFPFNGATWEKVSGPLLDAGYRVITYDRRGYGNSAQPAFGYDYDTFAADLDVLMTELDLRNTILVGHSMGTGEVTRYLGAYGSDRVDRAVLLAPLAPYLRQAPDNPEGVEASLFEGFKQAITQDRFAYLTQFCNNFFNYDENKGKLVSEEAYRAHWNIGAMASAKATHDSVDAWGTDFRADVSRIDVPVLIVQGDKDNVLPYPKTGQRLQPMLADSRLVTLKGAPHGTPWTNADEVNKAIMEFIGSPAMARA